MERRKSRATLFYGRLPAHLKHPSKLCRLGRKRRSGSPRTQGPFARGTPLGMALRIALWATVGQFFGIVVPGLFPRGTPPEPATFTAIALAFLSIVATVSAVRCPEMRHSAALSWLILLGWLLACNLYFTGDPSDIAVWGRSPDGMSVDFWPPQWQTLAQWVVGAGGALGMDSYWPLWILLWLAIPFAYRVGDRIQACLLIFASFASGVTLTLGVGPIPFVDLFADALTVGFISRWLVGMLYYWMG